MQKFRHIFLFAICAVGMLAAMALFTRHYVKQQMSSLDRQIESLRTAQLFSQKPLIDAYIRNQDLRGHADVTPTGAIPRGTWSRLQGGWPDGHYTKTKALAVHGELLCTGLSGEARGDAEVWCHDGDAWTQIGGDDVNASWTGKRTISFMVSNGESLAVGVESEVWIYGNGQWTLAGDVREAPDEKCYAYAGAFDGETLHIGPGNECGLKAYSYRGGEWKRLEFGLNARTQALYDKRFNGFYEIRPFRHGLVMGTISNFGTAAVFLYREGEPLEQIGGDGINGSWINPGFTMAENVADFKGNIVVSMDRQPIAWRNISAVWLYDWKEWKPVGRKDMPAQWRGMMNFNASVEYFGTLVVGGGGLPAGNASVWAVADKTALLGGAGVNGSWPNRMLDNSTAEYVYRLVVWKDRLVAGFGDAKGMGQVWIYTPD